MTLAETPPLQLILPTDKRNPSFSLYLTADERAIHVYYGLELLEVVPADREHVAYKLLVARLYNAGLRVRTLTEAEANTSGPHPYLFPTRQFNAG